MGKKQRLQFCMSEMGVTAGVAEVLHPCCPLPCIVSFWYLSVSVLSCLQTQQEVVCLYFFFYSFVSFFFPPARILLCHLSTLKLTQCRVR